MRRSRWLGAGAGLVAVAANGAACRSLLGLEDPIVEDEGGAAEGGSDGPGVADGADYGEASSVYPAYDLSVPRLVKGLGAAISQPHLQAVVFPSDPLAQEIATGGAVWVASSLWQTQTLEYGVGLTTATPILLTETAPASVTDDDVKTWLTGKLDGTHPEFGPVDTTTLASEVFGVLYPSGTTVTTPGGASCGYHGELTLGTARVTYVVVPRCSEALADLSAAVGYEVLAAVTNPRPVAYPAWSSFDPDHLAWNFLDGDGGTEVPQPCKHLPPVPQGDAGLVVVRSWSNSQMMEYHDPCVPTPDDSPYFASVPVMTDPVTLPGAYSTKGIQVGVHDSKTVAVELWSDRPTSGPWTVTASVLGSQPGALGFSINPPAGVNGQKLQLTVTAKQAGTYPFLLTSTLGGKSTFWVGLVGQQ